MKKSRVPKLSEPRYRSNRKLRTMKAEKSNITARRVTLLPGFLQGGVKSETVRRSSNSIEEPSPAYDDEVLKENLHGLLREDKPPRRSTRLSGRTSAAYFLQALAEPSPNRSKSIFKEIKEKYAQKVEQQVNRDFGARIFARLLPTFALKEARRYKEEIANEVAVINDILAGKLNPADMSLNRKRAFCEEDKENYPLKFSYVPPTKWVFQTPPNRKLNFSQAKGEETCIRPAIVENCKEGKVVYEVNNKINVDFSRYSNRQEIDIDKRYMVEVANAAGPSEDFTFQIHQDEEEEAREKRFQLRNDYYELENHFLSLTCRPKKAPCTVSRIPGLKRKRDIFEPEQPGCSTDLDTVHEFDSSFSFINNNLSNLEESFTFKFTANDGATTGHLFDFDGNKKDTFNFRF